MSSRSRRSSGPGSQSTTPATAIASTSANATVSCTGTTEGVPGSDNFLYKTMAARLATGKRQIRPLHISEDFVAEESDDPDFEMKSSRSARNGSDSDDFDSSCSNSGGESSDHESGAKKIDNEIVDVGDTSNASDSDESESDSDSNSSGQVQHSVLYTAEMKAHEKENAFAALKKRKPKRKRKVQKKKNETTSAADSHDVGIHSLDSNKAKIKPRRKSTVKTKTKNKIRESNVSKEKEKSKRRKLEKHKRKSKYSSISDLVNGIGVNLIDNRKELDWRDPICAACLSFKSDSENEILECDSCRITVHEGCYMIDDNSSVSSRTESSSSTEPWFCDSCKNDVINPFCELCPNSGGLFKETIDGRWVHLVCSLYVPDIDTGPDGKLDLTHIAYSKYGSRPCQLCENDRYSRVGMSVNCDAGLCRHCSHVTCAQKLGLLSDPNHVTGNHVQAADPYFVSCKLHANSEMSKQRLLNYKRLQEQIRIKKDQKSEENLTESEKLSQSEIQQKLDKIRQQVEIRNRERLSQITVLSTSTFLKNVNHCRTGSSKKKVHHILIPTQSDPLMFTQFKSKRKSRPLSSSTYALVNFATKIDRMGLDPTALEREEKIGKIVATVSKKHNVRPGFNVEFAAYYTDREHRIRSEREKSKRLDKENLRLTEKQVVLNSAFENEALNHMEAVEETLVLDSQITQLKTLLRKLAPGNKLLNKIRGANLKPIKSPPRRSSPSQHPQSKSSRGRNSPTRSRGGKSGGRKSFTGSPPPGRLALFQCAICERNNLQHLITRCDKCRKHFHLGCLDPPLTRLPKRTRQVGWSCSDCNELDSTVPEQIVDTDAPRELRGRTKIKRPAKYSEIDDSDIDEEFLRKEHKYLGPLGQSSSSPEINSSSINKLGQLQVRIKVEPMTLSNGNVKSHKSPSVGPSDSIGGIETDELSSSPSQKISKKVRISRRKNTNKEKKLKVKTLNATIKRESTEKEPPKKMGSGDGLPVPLPRKRTRRASSISQNSVSVLGLADGSPGTSGLTEAEKNKVDARSSFTFGVTKNVPSAVPATGSSNAGAKPSTSTNLLNTSAPETSSTSFNTNQNQPQTVKKPRKQKIIAKDSSASVNANFWNQPADLIIVSTPAPATSLSYNSMTSPPIGGKCDTCGKSDPSKNLVSCDHCSLEFHFLCLIPPLKYSPKRRGYSWFCANCDETSMDIDIGIKVQGTSKSPH